MHTETVRARSVLTRASGYLKTVCSHSLQPYRGCPFGASLCGVGCYVRHNGHITKGREWGSFLEVRENAGLIYEQTCDRERRWAHRARERFVIFLSSATEPFPPQEARYGATASVLEAMIANPPDGLIVQTHSPRVVAAGELLRELNGRCDLRVHISIESDQDRLPGLPPPASSVASRLEAAARLRASGLRVIVTVSPLLPIADPDAFFERIAEAADGVVIDHYIGGDGSAGGSRTARTPLPAAMAAVNPASVGIAYRDQIVELARRCMPGRVGVHIDGFAGRFLPS
jgi:DNA repair photolyase